MSKIKLSINEREWKVLIITALAIIFILQFTQVTQAKLAYYEPTTNITTGWNRGTGIGFYEIDDGTRTPTIPNTADYISSRVNDGVTSNFGFNSLQLENRTIVNMTLWVYTGTGTNSEYSFNLYQSGVSRCTTLISSNTANSWRRCTWLSASGSFNAMSIYLGTVGKIGGGGPTNANVYSTYLEVFEDWAPSVLLTTPTNGAIINKSFIDFNFTVNDDISSIIPNCTLYANFSSNWQAQGTIYNINNATNRNISKTVSDGFYIWNVLCYDGVANNVSYYQNYTFRVDTTPPVVNLILPLNNTDNKTTNNIDFSYNVADINTILNCSLYVNGTLRDYVISPQKETPLTFTYALSNGNYNWSVLCFDEANNSGMSNVYYLNVSYFPPIINNISLEKNINLIPNSVKYATCNITVYNNQGSASISSASAVLKLSSVAYASPDDYNNHYTNNTCIEIASGAFEKNYTCGFYLKYYAVNGTWDCNATATILPSITVINSTTETLMPLYAINIADEIDYGDVVAGEYSSEKIIEIQNAGNMNLNISVRGYGGTDPITGDGFAFSCATRNITIENERFASNPLIPFASKKSLLSTNQDMGFTMPKQNVEGLNSLQNTYWELYVPPGEISYCIGTISFIATSQN